MKVIGYWMRNLHDMFLPLPQELVGAMPVSVVNAVCTYLRRGSVLHASRGCSWCRFRCGIDRDQMGYRDFTDGEWIWPEGLAHYVALHNVVLPAEFICCATS